MTQESTETETSRRNYVKAAAALGVLGSLGPRLAAGRQDEDGTQTTEEEEATRIEMLGVTSGWRATAPEAIAGQTNPTLELEVGRVYEFVWRNGDGQPHNIALQDADGNNLQVLLPVEIDPATVTITTQTTTPGTETTTTETTTTETTTTTTTTTTGTETVTPLEGDLVAQTELVQEQGAVQAARFRATRAMAQYYCTVHPTTMVGDVSFGAEEPL